MKSRVACLAVVLALLSVGCSGSKGGGQGTPSTPSQTTTEPKRGGTFSFASCEPDSLVPQKDYETCGAQVLEVLFTRLVSFDQATSKPVMAQADSITSPDDRVWTIKIKSGWTFHNGDPVTAQTYVDAWNWAALGKNGAVLNFFFDRIEGYGALNPSEGEPTATALTGLKVVDPVTFEVTLSASFSQFPIELGFDAFDPLPKAFFDDPDAYNEQPVGDGPYMMDGAWKHDELISLRRYPNYAGPPGYADAISLPEYTGGAEYVDFQGGNVDIALVNSEHLKQAEQDYPDQLQRLTSSSILFLSFPLYDPRFQSKELRQALSLGVDRSAVIAAILPNETPADSFVPPVIAGYRPGACQYCKLDVALAKQKLADAGGWTGEMTINFSADQTVLEQAMEAVANQWRQNLGIQDIKLNPIDPNSIYDVEAQKQMKGPWFDGWLMDYPSMQDYLAPIYSKNGSYNLTFYDNAAVDRLLAQGDAAPDNDASIAAYQQAEDLLLEDMPSMPWGYGGLNILSGTRVTNVVKAGPLDYLSLELVQVTG